VDLLTFFLRSHAAVHAREAVTIRGLAGFVV
jgi:hypothetical protein